MRSSVMICMLILMVSTGCSKYEFDGFDPTTTVLKWMTKTNKGETNNGDGTRP
jgi:hypothetical protein